MIQIGVVELLLVVGMVVGVIVGVRVLIRGALDRSEHRAELDPEMHEELEDMRGRLLETEERLDSAEEALRRDRERTR